MIRKCLAKQLVHSKDLINKGYHNHLNSLPALKLSYSGTLTENKDYPFFFLIGNISPQVHASGKNQGQTWVLRKKDNDCSCLGECFKESGDKQANGFSEESFKES